MILSDVGAKRSNVCCRFILVLALSFFLVSCASKEEQSLFSAIERNEVAQVSLVLSNAPHLVNIPNSNSIPPLHFASLNGRLEIVKIILSFRADPNVKDELGLTPLHYASLNGYLNICDELLRAGADPNLQDNGGKTPLHFASSTGRPKIVRLLRENHAKVDIRDREGLTAMDKAKESQHESVVEVLKE